jgi:hypothetical protein
MKPFRLKTLASTVLSLLLTVGASTPPVLLPLGVAGVVVTQSSCDKNRVREARKAAFRIQVVTDAAVDTTASLFERRVITKEQTSKIAQALLKVNHANRILIERAAGMTEDNATNRAALFATVREISGAIRELKDAGVLEIKNPDGSAAFDAAVAALDTSLASIEASLAGGGS